LASRAARTRRFAGDAAAVVVVAMLSDVGVVDLAACKAVC
jgi:hypothetical protein